MAARWACSGPIAGIVEAGRDRVRLGDLALLVLEQVRLHAVHDAGHAPAHGRAAGGLHPDEAAVGVDEAGEGPRRVGPAADAGHDHVGVGPAEERPALLAGLVAHHPLQLAHHPRVGMRAHDRAQAVVGVVDGGHPVPQRLVDGVLQGAAPGSTGRTSAPSSSMRKTLSAWRSVSTSPM